MTSGHLAAFLRHFRNLAGVHETAALSDRHLLERFTHGRDEAAFAALLRRHGGMVWSVCRRVLADSTDAEDAFQATFLVLLHKAAALRQRESLAGWLQGVAWRLARKVKAEAARRRLKEARAGQRSESDFTEEMERRDLRGLLDEELDRLPEKYRAPLVLCYLEGMSYTEAARQLGWRDGTVCGRLARARELLRKRLIHRGLTLSGASLIAALSEQATAPAATVAATSRMATLFGLGQAVAGVVSPPVATLAQGVLQAMHLAKLKTMAMVVVTLTLLAAGAGLAAPHFLTQKPPEKAIASAIPPEQPKSDKPERKDLYGDPLPPGALVRMGTVRFRHPNLIGNVAYSRDGKILAAAGFGGIIRLYDPETGKTFRQFQANSRQYPSIAFAPDGKTLACLGMRIIHIWEVSSGKELRHFAVQADNEHFAYSTNPLVFSLDGKLLAAMAPDLSVRVWEATTGKELVQLRGHQSLVCCLAFSPDGKTLLAASDRHGGERGGSVHVWSVAKGEELKKISLHRPKEMSDPTPLGFSPDRKTLAVASWEMVKRKHAKGATVYSGQAISLLDLDSGKVRRKLEPLLGRVKAASFSPDAKIFTALNDWQASDAFSPKDEISRIKGWDTSTGKEIFNLPAFPTSALFWGGDGTLLAFRPDGKKLAAASGSSLHVWDLARGREQMETPQSHECQVYCVSFSPDGRTLASASSDHSVALWDAGTGRERLRLSDQKGAIASMVFSPDGKLLALASRDGEQAIQLYDRITGKIILHFKPPHLPVGDGSFWVINSWVAFADNGKVLAACGSDGTLRRWDTASGKELFNQRVRGLPPLPKGHDAFRSFTRDPVFSSDGRVLAFSIHPTTYIVDVAAGQVLFQYPKRAMFPVLALSPDGKMLFCPAPGAFRLVEVASGRDIRKVDLSEPKDSTLVSPEGRRIIAQAIFAAAFSPDGRIVAVSAGEAHASIRLFDVATGKELLRLQGHQAHVPSLAFSPDGTKLASGQWDSTALIWDVSSARRNLPRKDLTPHDLEHLWTELRDTDAVKAHAALWTLVAAPDKAVPFFKEHLHPVPRATPERLRRWIADLDADDYAHREEASRSLAQLGSEAEPALRKALEEKSAPELRRRVKSLLDGLACQTAMTPDALRQLRAIQLLAQIASPQARQILAALAEGAPAAPGTRDAVAALARLRR